MCVSSIFASTDFDKDLCYHRAIRIRARVCLLLLLRCAFLNLIKPGSLRHAVRLILRQIFLSKSLVWQLQVSHGIHRPVFGQRIVFVRLFRQTARVHPVQERQHVFQSSGPIVNTNFSLFPTRTRRIAQISMWKLMFFFFAAVSRRASVCCRCASTACTRIEPVVARRNSRVYIG